MRGRSSLAVLAYTVVLISFNRYAVADLAPMAVLPLALLWFGRVPVWFALRRVVILSPFILMFVLISPIYDRVPRRCRSGRGDTSSPAGGSPRPTSP